MGLRVGIVGSDETARLKLVRALDAAPATWHLSLHKTVPEDVDVVVCDPAVEAAGAVVVSDGTIDVIERITRQAGPTGRALVVCSPCGGAGTTSVAIHLAAELARRGHSTCVVDLDIEWGMRGRLGLEPADGADPDLPVPVPGGFRLLRGIGGLDTARTNFDRVVVDAPTTVLGELTAAHDGLLVIPPTPEGARRAGILLDQHPAFHWSVIANRTGPGGETTLAQLSRITGVPIIELPCCAALRDSEDDGRLIARGWSRWSRALARVTDGIEGAG